MDNASLGNDSLSRYLQWAINNISSTRQHNGKRFSQCVRLDQAFETAFRNFSDFEECALLAPLLFRSWHTFRGSCMMVMSGQAAEAYILMRGCLEAAMYALHIEINPDLRMIWLNRDKDPESRNACINRFQQRKVAKTLQDKSKWLSEIATQLYEHTIDLGAHPNKRSATDCLEIDTDVENKTLTMRYEVGRPDQITDAWEATCHVGACALHIMQLARPDYFKRLEIDAMLDEITKEL